MSSGKVKCTCGWSWNKSDSSKKDMYICHECGRDNSNNMKNGGWLDSYADGGTMQEHQENYNDASVSLPEGFVGMGNNTKGRDYSPAWGGQFQNGGPIKPSQKDYKTKGEYNAALKSYNVNLHKYELANNPERLKGESAKDYETRTKYFNFKIRQEQDKDPITKSYLEMKDDQETATNPVVKTLRQVFTSPAHVAHGIYNAANPKDLDKYKSRATKNDEDLDLVNSSLDAASLLIPFDYGMKANPLWKQAAIRTAKETVEDALFNVGKKVNHFVNSFQGGGEVYPVNYVPEAQNGISTFRPIMPVIDFVSDKISSWFGNDDDDDEEKAPVKKPVVKNNTRTLNIVDPRKKMMTTNQPLRPNVDLLTGKYSSYHLDKLIQEAKIRKLPRKDIENISAMGFQETKWDREGEGNIGHTTRGFSDGKDQYSDFIDAYLAKMKEADRLGIKDPAMRLQVYNGMGIITPKTEKNYHGFEMKKIYGVPVPPEGISMKKNPLYGKQVIDVRDNVLAKNPEYVQYLDSIYKAPVPEYMQDVRKNKLVVPPLAMGGSLPGATGHFYARYEEGGKVPGDVGFDYPRTINPAPDNGPGAKKTMASAQNGQEMKYYQEGLDFKPKTISRDGSVIEDDMGQWAHPGEITRINSPYITMEGVPYPVLGVSDTGDVQMMYPEEDYEFDGESVTEYPMAKNGLRQEQKGLVNLDNLLNFTNYNTKQPGGWLDNYN